MIFKQWVYGFLAAVLCMTSCGYRDVFFGGRGGSVLVTPLNSAARRGLVSLDSNHSSAAAFFSIDSSMITSGAAELSVDCCGTDGCTLYFGYLFERDFDEKGVLRSEALDSRPMAAVANDDGHVSVALSCSTAGSDVPRGFVVALRFSDTAVPDDDVKRYVSITSFAAAQPLSGWNVSSGGDLSCSFSEAGGFFDCTRRSYQDYGVLACVPLNSWRVCVEVRPDCGAESVSFAADSGQVSAFSCIVPPHEYTAVFPGIVFGAKPGAVSCTGGADAVASFVVERCEPPYAGASRYAGDIVPISADPGLITVITQKQWRRDDFELYAWDRFPSVLIFDTATYGVQSSFFKRLAFFVEKAGYRGQLLTDDEMSGMHGYNAHDYRAESLAEFFSAAHREHFELNRYEMMLRDILITRDVIRIDGGGKGRDAFTAGNGAVISISKDSTLFLRSQFLVHEGLHGIYFTDEPFRQKVHEVYSGMDPYAIEFIETYFTAMDSLQYDINDCYLMENEFMAYIMQQTLEQIPDYFVGKYNRRLKVRSLVPSITQIVDETNAAAFTSAGIKLGSYVKDRWHLDCGRVHLLEVQRKK